MSIRQLYKKNTIQFPVYFNSINCKKILINNVDILLSITQNITKTNDDIINVNINLQNQINIMNTKINKLQLENNIIKNIIYTLLNIDINLIVGG